VVSADLERHPVRQMEPNAFGLFDMIRNVWEWVTSLETSRRLLRGDDWCTDYTEDLRVSISCSLEADGRDYGLRFRCSRDWATYISVGVER
jgi:formylglycine-generating enzyme required for sulfatase activity